MSLTHYTGFNGLDVATDMVVVQAGAPVYDTSVPPDSLASRSLSLTGTDIARMQWWSGDTQVVPSADVYLHFRMYMGANDAFNDQIRCGVAMDNTEVISVSVANNTALLTLRVAGAVVATAAVGGEVVPATWTGNRYVLVIGGYAEGDVISLHRRGDVLSAALVSYTLTGANETALTGIGLPNETRLEMVSSGSVVKFTDLCVMDPNNASGFVDPAIFTDFTVKGAVFVTDSTPSDWVGTVTDIDELPASSADFIQTEAVDAQSVYTRNNIAGLVANAYAARFLINGVRTGTTAGTLIGVQLDDGATSENTATMPLAPDDTVAVYHQTPPSGGSWNPAKMDASTASLFSRT